MLTAIFAVNHLDRHLLSILLEPIKRELVLSDIQLGLLSGYAFALVYAVLGVPAALWAARGNRVNLIAGAVAVWSVMTLACGFAQNFWQMAVARLGVGVGEAGCTPAAHAIISDMYAPHERTSALSVYSCGANLGIFLAFLVGGFLAQKLGWRGAFYAAAVPGLAAALVLRIIAPAQILRAPDATSGETWSRGLVRTAVGEVGRQSALRHALAGAALTATVGYGALAWLPSFFIRSHGLMPAQVGIFLALTIGIGGALGTALSGRLADRLAMSDPRWRYWVVALAILIAKPFVFVALLVDDVRWAMALYVVPALLAGVFLGPTFALFHDRLGGRLRPLGTAILLFVFNLIGLGLGPFLVGVFSDLLFADQGVDALRFAMITMQGVGVWAAYHYVMVARRVGQDAESGRSSADRQTDTSTRVVAP